MTNTVLRFLCLAVFVGTIACSGPGEENGKDPEKASATCGIYTPLQKIDYILPAEGVPEIWLWNGDLLEALADDDQCGGYTEKCWLGYEDQQLTYMQSAIEGMPYEAEYTYTNGQLENVYATSMGNLVLAMQFGYDEAKHVTRIGLNLSPALLGFFTSTVMDMEGIEISEPEAEIHLDWQGDNVASLVLTTEVDASVTLGQAKELVDLEAIAGSYASLIDLLPDSTILPLHIDITDTIEYTYDSHPNPIRGLLTTPDVAVLNENNQLSAYHHGTTVLAITLQTAFGNLTLPYPIPISPTHTAYTYTYSENGLPLDVIQDGEIVKTYNYKQ